MFSCPPCHDEQQSYSQYFTFSRPSRYSSFSVVLHVMISKSPPANTSCSAVLEGILHVQLSSVSWSAAALQLIVHVQPFLRVFVMFSCPPCHDEQQFYSQYFMFIRPWGCSSFSVVLHVMISSSPPADTSCSAVLKGIRHVQWSAMLLDWSCSAVILQSFSYSAVIRLNSSWSWRAVPSVTLSLFSHYLSKLHYVQLSSRQVP